MRPVGKEDSPPSRAQPILLCRRGTGLLERILADSVQTRRAAGRIFRQRTSCPFVLGTRSREHAPAPVGFREARQQVHACRHPAEVLGLLPELAMDGVPGEVEEMRWTHLMHDSPTLAELEQVRLVT